MGGKQTKIEGSHHPETPPTQCKTSPIYSESCDARTDLDPRSPAGCRTPIILQTESNSSIIQSSGADTPKPYHNNEKTLDTLRKRFLKSFTCNFNDPRSPTLNLNRTPLLFDDTFEKTLSLDDTFSNLFVEPVLPGALNEVDQLEDVSKKESCVAEGKDKVQKEGMIMDLEEMPTRQDTPIALQQEFDPRSPSIGVERTPIIFTDDEVDESSEDVMLENILATLSLGMNSSGSISAMSRESEDVSTKKVYSQVVPLNKHLDRVRTGKKIALKSKLHKPMRRTSHRKIYEDQENYLPLTPVLKTREPDKNYLKGTRTPLSCVRNRYDTHVRSRSVELSAKSIKTRLTLTSFDDTLNPTEQGNVRVARQGSQDSINLN